MSSNLSHIIWIQVDVGTLETRTVEVLLYFHILPFELKYDLGKQFLWELAVSLRDF